MELIKYIDEFYNGSQKEFAADQGVKPQQVTQWLDKGFVVIDHVLYSPRRELAKKLNSE